MRHELELKSTIYLYDHFEQLSNDDQELIKQAKKAVNNSYSPYSHFKVGASILLDNRSILIGSNQENASYPLCVCAETSVLSMAGSNHPDHKILAMAISTNGPKITDHPAAPCGACRQIILEYEKRQESPIRILLHADGQQIIEIPSIKTILPLHFDNRYL